MPFAELQMMMAVCGTVLGSVFLVFTCLSFGRFTKKNRSASSPSWEKSKSSDVEQGVNQTKGITNCGCEDTEKISDIYEICDDTTVKKNVPESEAYYANAKLGPDNETDFVNGCVYDVLEPPSDDAAISDPVYFTLERQSEKKTNTEREFGDDDLENVNLENESLKNKNLQNENLGSTNDISRQEDSYAIDIPEEIYENMHRNEHGAQMDNKGLNKMEEEEDKKTKIHQIDNINQYGSGKGVGHTNDEGMYNDVQEDKDCHGITDEDSVYVISIDELSDKTSDDANPDDGIYENWENETICKSQVRFESADSLYLNENVVAMDDGSYSNFSEMEVATDQDQDSGFESIYENLKDFRNSQVESIGSVYTENERSSGHSPHRWIINPKTNATYNRADNNGFQSGFVACWSKFHGLENSFKSKLQAFE